MNPSASNENLILTRYLDVKAALGSQDLTRSIDVERYEKGNIEEGTVSLLHGLDHRDRRRLENELFRRGTLELYEQVVFPDVIAHTLARFVDDSPSDLMEIGGLLTVVLACRIAGVDFNQEVLAERQRLRWFLHRFALGTAIDVANVDPEVVKAQMREALVAFEEEFLGASRARREVLVEGCLRGEIPRGELPADILTRLLLARAEGVLEMDDALLMRETTSFFSAGAHTSSQTITNTFHQVFAWCQEHPEDWGRLSGDLHFVQRTVQEALRCRPTNPMIHRRALRHTAINGRQVAAGTIVLLDTVAANTDVAAFGEEGRRFNPHRTVSLDVPAFGVSFGGGMHLCIGRTLAVGLPVRGDSEAAAPDQQLYGFIPRVVQALVRRGVQPDPDGEPVPDTRTQRWTRWLNYPVRFDPARAWPALAR